MGNALVNVVDVDVGGEQAAAPVSFQLRRREIHGLLFPPHVERGAVLRVVAGLERPRAGRVSMPDGPVRVTMSVRQRMASEASDVMLVDEAVDDLQAPGAWARIAAERERGATVVISTSREEQAYRSDRVSLVMWDAASVQEAFERLNRRMSSLVTEFLTMLEAGRDAPNAAAALRLYRLNRAARDLLREAGKYRFSLEQMRAMRALSSQQVNDRVLEAAIRKAYEG